MNKTELISAVAEKSGASKMVTVEVVDALLNTIVDTVATSSDVRWLVLEPLHLQKEKEKKPSIHSRKKTLSLAPSTAEKFRTGKAFKDAVNQQITNQRTVKILG